MRLGTYTAAGDLNAKSQILVIARFPGTKCGQGNLHRITAISRPSALERNTVATLPGKVLKAMPVEKANQVALPIADCPGA